MIDLLFQYLLRNRCPSSNLPFPLLNGFNNTANMRGSVLKHVFKNIKESGKKSNVSRQCLCSLTVYTLSLSVCLSTECAHSHLFSVYAHSHLFSVYAHWQSVFCQSVHWVCSVSLCSVYTLSLSVCSLSVLSHLSSVYAHWQFTLSVCSLTNHIGGIMVSVLVSSAVDCGFESWSGQTKDYEIGICFFSSKQAAIMRKSKDGLAQNRGNVSVWGVISIHRLLFQWANTIKIQLIMLV